MLKFSRLEINEIAKAWLAVSAMFAIAFNGFNSSLLVVFPLSLLTAGAGFVLHELAHKFVAQHYGCHAEFRAFNQMLLFGLILSFADFVFAAPGAVFFKGRSSRRVHGRVALAGPVMNIVLGAVFLVFTFLSSGWVYDILLLGFRINAWLALFNLIPFPPFDGSAVFRWNRFVYASVIILASVLFVLA